jgi:polyisoprenoid-binding protein YceI
MMERPDYAEWARSPEFFDAARHPWIRFNARGVPLQLFGDGGTLDGALTLRGITRPATLELLPSDCDEPGLGCPVRAEGELSRSAFGMTARRFVLSDKVRLAFTIRIADPAAAPSVEATP